MSMIFLVHASLVFKPIVFNLWAAKVFKKHWFITLQALFIKKITFWIQKSRFSLWFKCAANRLKGPQGVWQA